MLTPEGSPLRKGLEGCGAATAQRAGAGARKRGAPQSPVFCAAKNAPNRPFFIINVQFKRSADCADYVHYGCA
jgi:hypothetical protein